MNLEFCASEYEKNNKIIDRLLNNFLEDRMRITFCGKFKTGKSSLINALLGTNLLPVKSTTATAVFTKVFYSKKPIAYIIKEEQKIDISFDEISDWVLIKDKTLNGVKTSGIKEVGIGIPNPLLKGIVLIDTPGLDDDEELTKVTLNQLQNTDLAVIVYDANQLFSTSEKETVQYINELLSGNVVFVVNRIDQICGGNIEDIKEAADYYLKDMGNSIVGKPSIFYTAADGKDKNIACLKDWMKTAFDSAFKRSVCKRSRLSIIQKHINEIKYYLDRDINNIQNQIVELNTRNTDEINKKKSEKRAELKKLKNDIAFHELSIFDLLSTDCIDKCKKRLENLKRNKNWDRSFHKDAKETVKAYYKGFLSDHNSEVVNELALDFIENPQLELDKTFDNINFPKAVASSSGWKGTIIGAVIGTIVLIVVPGLGTIIGAVIGKIFDAAKANSNARDQCISDSIYTIQTKITPEIHKKIEEYYNGLIKRIDIYADNLTFTSKYQQEIDEYTALLDKLHNVQSEIQKHKEILELLDSDESVYSTDKSIVYYVILTLLIGFGSYAMAGFWNLEYWKVIGITIIAPFLSGCILFKIYSGRRKRQEKYFRRMYINPLASFKEPLMELCKMAKS